MIDPSTVIEQYKQAMGIDAKLIAVAMTATQFSVADLLNPNMLDVVGFDSSGPKSLANSQVNNESPILSC